MDDLTVRQAALELGIPDRTIHYRLKTGTMRGQQLAGWQWLIPREEVERWRGQGKIKPGRRQISDSRRTKGASMTERKQVRTSRVCTQCGSYVARRGIEVRDFKDPAAVLTWRYCSWGCLRDYITGSPEEE